MAVVNFVPDIWSARILTALSRNAVAGGIVNRDYEGDIRGGGDSVKITNFVDPTIGNYTKHTDITIEDIPLEDIIAEHTAGLKIPILTNAPFGHDPALNYIMPIGQKVELSDTTLHLL